MTKKDRKDGNVEVVMLSTYGEWKAGEVVVMSEDTALHLSSAFFASMDVDQIAYARSAKDKQ